LIERLIYRVKQKESLEKKEPAMDGPAAAAKAMPKKEEKVAPIKF